MLEADSVSKIYFETCRFEDIFHIQPDRHPRCPMDQHQPGQAKRSRNAQALARGDWGEVCSSVICYYPALNCVRNWQARLQRCQTLVHKNVYYMHSMTDLCAPRVFYMTLRARQSLIYGIRSTIMCTKVWRMFENPSCSTGAGKIRQASSSERLRKLRLKACYTFLRIMPAWLCR